MKKTDLKKYYKFRNTNLPVPFRNKDRGVLEYVHINNKDLKSLNDISIYDNIEHVLSGLSYTGLYYPYTSMLSNYKDGVYNPEVGHTHAHNFEEVLISLYDYPESFNIEKEDEEYYSLQELRYLNQVKKYLLFVGLKNKPIDKDPVSRYKSKNQELYGDYPIRRKSGKQLKDILSGKINYYLTTYYGSNLEGKTFKPGEYKELITDGDDNFKLLVEVTKVEFHDIKEYEEYFDLSKNKDKCKYVCVTYINILKRF